VGACTVNPLANLPFDPLTLPPAAEKKRVLVVGGGVAGMQAAITAFDRGHNVTLAERSDRLGGLLFFTDTDPDKPDLRNFRDLLIREVGRRGINVRLGTAVTPENLKDFAPEAIIIATGSLPVTPPIPGIGNAVQALELHRGVTAGKNVVMVGGGLVGTEEGLALAKAGRTVTVIEMLPRAANEVYGMYREALMREIAKENMVLRENTKCLEIGKDFVRVLRPDGQEETLPADTVVYALGLKPAPYQALLDAAGGIPCEVIGDAVSPAKVDQATRGGYLAGIRIGAGATIHAE